MNPTAENDFSTGSIPAHMLRLALPMTLAQLINVLYKSYTILLTVFLSEESPLILPMR